MFPLDLFRKPKPRPPLDPEIEEKKRQALIERQKREAEWSRAQARKRELQRACGKSPLGHVYEPSRMFDGFECVGCEHYSIRPRG